MTPKSLWAAPYTEVYEAKNGVVVKVSFFADESDFAANLKSAIVIADNLGVNMNIYAAYNYWGL